jgi:hypothetical protein
MAEEKSKTNVSGSYPRSSKNFAAQKVSLKLSPVFLVTILAIQTFLYF